MVDTMADMRAGELVPVPGVPTTAPMPAVLNARERVARAYIALAGAGADENAIALKAGVRITEVRAMLADPVFAATAEAHLSIAEIEGLTLKPRLNALALRLLARIEAEADQLDALEAATALRAVNAMRG